MIESIDPYLFSTGLKAQVFIVKVTSLLSMAGSTSIIVIHFRDPEKRTKMYNKIVLWMSVCDTISSLIHFLGTWMMPKHFAYLAGGTSLTCTIQGFIAVFIMSTSSFYNAVLAITFVLVIIYNWREEDLQRIKWKLLSIPIVLSLSLSIAALVGQLFNPRRGWLCFIGSYPPDCDLESDLECERGNPKMHRILLIVTLLFIFTVLITVISCMLLLYRAVIPQGQRALHNSFNRRASTGQRYKEVAMLGIKYVGAYLITWLWYIILVILVILRIKLPLFLQIMNSIFLPMQGFFNAMIYYKTPYKLFCYYCCRCGRRETIGNDDESENDDDNESENDVDNESDNDNESSVLRNTGIITSGNSERQSQLVLGPSNTIAPMSNTTASFSGFDSSQ